MEAYERYVDPARCETLLKETLAKRPDFVRAQANLVLVDQGTEAKHEELQRLKAMSPKHLVVRLAGPMIEQEFKTSQELNQALQD
jgi:adenylate cyclase class IV